MEDARIVDLYWARSEAAINETASKYGRYCYTIAHNILSNPEDADESVNDTYLDAWNSMPPHRPAVLSSYLGKITRRISIDRWRYRNADKRGAGEVPLALDELSDCIPSADSMEQRIEEKELTKAVNAFLSTLSAIERDIFISRYWFLFPLKRISAKLEISESKVKTTLFFTRKKLTAYLHKEGF